MPASEAQRKHLEKAREERNKHQALLTQIKELEDRLAKWEELGDIFHDEGISYMQYARRINDLRNSWTPLFDKLVELSGPVPY